MLLRSEGSEALDHAIAAAELYMKSARAAPNGPERNRLKSKCEELILRAEVLKTSGQAGNSTVRARERTGPPRSAREVPKDEKKILLLSSRLHGNIFPPWESDPRPGEFNGAVFR